MDNENSKIDINKLLNLIFQFFEKVDKYCLKIQNNEIVNNIYRKADNTALTDLDWLTQKLFENMINKYFHNLLIVGEEDTSKLIPLKNIEKNELLTSIDEFDINKNVFPITKDYDFLQVKNEQNIKDLIIYIDPIDGTNSLAKKKFNSATVLIGICLKCKPYIGIVHYPFTLNDYKNQISVFSYPEKGVFKYIDSNNIEKINYNDKNKNKWIFYISATRTLPKHIDFINHFPNAEYVQLSGMGNKGIHVILNDAIYFTPYAFSLSKWDVCGIDCIAREFGGGLYTFDGQQISYGDVEHSDIENNLFLVNNKDRVEFFIKQVKQYYKE